MGTPTPAPQWLNERVFYWTFGEPASPALTAKMAACQQRLQAQFNTAISDLVMGYQQLTVTLCRHYEQPEKPQLLAEWMTAAIAPLLAQDHAFIPAGKAIEIPVWYDPLVAPDLITAAHTLGLTPSELIALHSGKTYSVAALGFAPGFAYLGYLDERLQLPRKASPRLSVPAGSVAIADNQTGIYPSESPGGWQIIGRTPLRCFDPFKPLAEASLLSVGMQVIFVPISANEYQQQLQPPRNAAPITPKEYPYVAK